MATIVPVTLADIPTLVAVSRETFAATFDANTAPADMQAFLDSAYNPEQLTAELQTPGTTFWFVKVADDVAGYLKCNIDDAVTEDGDPNGLELERIYIRPGFQHQGLGHLLFAQADKLARAAHKQVITLGVWEGNVNAQRFYQRFGFYRTGEHTFQVGNDPQTDWLMAAPVIDVQIAPTARLSAEQLLDVMAARVKVFVVEQHCAYQEVDELDRTAVHVMFRQGDRLVAYARLFDHPDGEHVSLGRVLVEKVDRGHGLARRLLTVCLATLRDTFPKQPIKIQAQTYLEDFYASFGFKPTSEPYLEDGIPHLDMEKPRP